MELLHLLKKTIPAFILFIFLYIVSLLSGFNIALLFIHWNISLWIKASTFILTYLIVVAIYIFFREFIYMTQIWFESWYKYKRLNGKKIKLFIKIILFKKIATSRDLIHMGGITNTSRRKIYYQTTGLGGIFLPTIVCLVFVLVYFYSFFYLFLLIIFIFYSFLFQHVEIFVYKFLILRKNFNNMKKITELKTNKGSIIPPEFFRASDENKAWRNGIIKKILIIEPKIMIELKELKNRQLIDLYNRLNKDLYGKKK